jgi:intraflagellar transport protein 88
LCVEAIYNLGKIFIFLSKGIVYKREGKYDLALKWFEKLHSIVNNSSEVIFEIADIYDKIGNLALSLEWYNILISVVPTDPGILAKLANMFERNGDRAQAFQYYSEVIDTF